jgi:hypothetical protein
VESIEIMKGGKYLIRFSAAAVINITPRSRKESNWNGLHEYRRKPQQIELTIVPKTTTKGFLSMEI